ncbi:MAG: hypothetical protein HY351_00625 [Candidatus Omnitrophica bacterium]|nr:hypothetical protein [Candidatus Omnitrophota bacterium]
MALNEAVIVRDAIEDLSKNIRFTSGEIATFKEAICNIILKVNESSNGMLKASKWYFGGSLLLSAVIAFSALFSIIEKYFLK